MDNELYNIGVEVKTRFLEEQVQDGEPCYAFAYTVTIKNRGRVGAKLLSRHWIITDSDQRVQEVQGDGVVGKQPFLEPGESFRYSSGTLLETPVGSMRGTYRMLAEDGTVFEAPIPDFTLATPRILN